MVVNRLAAAVVAVVCLALATGCVRVPRHVSLPPLLLGEPSFFPTLEAYAGAPIVGGNRVDLLLNGEEIFPTRAGGGPRGPADDHLRAVLLRGRPGRPRHRGGARRALPRGRRRQRAARRVRLVSGCRGRTIDVMRHAGCHVVVVPAAEPVTSSAATTIATTGASSSSTAASASRAAPASAASGWATAGTEHHWRDTDVRVAGAGRRVSPGRLRGELARGDGHGAGRRGVLPAAASSPRGEVYAQVVRSSPAGGSFAMYTMFLLALSSAQRVASSSRTRTSSPTTRCRGRAALGAPRACGWSCWCRARSTTTSCARRAAASSGDCCGRASRSTSTARRSCTRRRWSSTACGRRSAARTSTTARSRVNDELNLVVYDRGRRPAPRADLRGRPQGVAARGLPAVESSRGVRRGSSSCWRSRSGTSCSRAGRGGAAPGPLQTQTPQAVRPGTTIR